jgi:hypothetical protein
MRPGQIPRDHLTLAIRNTLVVLRQDIGVCGCDELGWVSLARFGLGWFGLGWVGFSSRLERTPLSPPMLAQTLAAMNIYVRTLLNDGLFK